MSEKEFSSIILDSRCSIRARKRCRHLLLLLRPSFLIHHGCALVFLIFPIPLLSPFPSILPSPLSHLFRLRFSLLSEWSLRINFSLFLLLFLRVLKPDPLSLWISPFTPSSPDPPLLHPPFFNFLTNRATLSRHVNPGVTLLISVPLSSL